MFQSATAHMNLGAMYHMNGKLKEAEASYLRALELKPDRFKKVISKYLPL
jgi:Flp pilus assembly protein TadD